MGRPDIADMSDREILEELLAGKRRADMFRWIKLIFWMVIFAVIIGVLIRVVPLLMEMYRSYNEMVDQTGRSLEKVNQLLENFSPETAEKIMEHLDKISEVMERVARLFGR